MSQFRFRSIFVALLAIAACVGLFTFTFVPSDSLPDNVDVALAATPIPRPVISLRVSRTVITAGQCVSVTWNTRNVRETQLQGQVVAGRGTRQECPAQDATFVLTVITADGQKVERQVSVKVRVPTPTKSPAEQVKIPDNSATVAEELLNLVNAARAQAGQPPLTLNAALNAAAQGHSTDMAAKNYFAHEALDGSGPDARISRAGYAWRTCGENIAQTWRVNAAEVFRLWMDSPGHRDNILHADFREMGLGVAIAKDGKVYYTQTFGTP